MPCDVCGFMVGVSGAGGIIRSGRIQLLRSAHIRPSPGVRKRAVKTFDELFAELTAKAAAADHGSGT